MESSVSTGSFSAIDQMKSLNLCSDTPAHTASEGSDSGNVDSLSTDVAGSLSSDVPATDISVPVVSSTCLLSNGDVSSTSELATATAEHSIGVMDQNDAGGFGKIGISSTFQLHPVSPPHLSYGITTAARHDDYYSMNSKFRGHCLIFNHRDFDPILNMNTRNGTNKDREEIRKLFSQLGFLVHVYNDLTYDGFKEIIEQFSLNTDHTELDCLAVFFLSHGEEGVFYTKDTPFKQDILFKSFEGDQCPSLAGKPKMFFIQACRGGKLDSAVDMMDQTDAPTFSHKLPVSADVFTMWSTVPGYYSWRNTTNGSWFIQSLVSVFKTHARYLDLSAMHPLINRHTVYKFESNTPGDRTMHGMKQISSLVATPTRLMHFYPPGPHRKA